jgi:hypothetical protein
MTFSPAQRVRTTKVIAAMLIALVAAVCLAATAEAAVTGSVMPDCSDRVCGEHLACGASTQASTLPTSQTLLVAILPTIDVPATPAPRTDVVAVALVDVALHRQVAPLGPRSPPLG